jgi:hypothetical protein
MHNNPFQQENTAISEVFLCILKYQYKHVGISTYFLLTAMTVLNVLRYPISACLIQPPLLHTHPLRAWRKKS